MLCKQAGIVWWVQRPYYNSFQFLHKHSPSLREGGKAFQEPGGFRRNERRKAVPVRALVTCTQRKGGPEAKVDIFPNLYPYAYDGLIEFNP